LEFWGGKQYLRLGTVFFWIVFFYGLEFGWTVTREHQLLGFLGSGARDPHRILELGSQIGSVPSWQGGKIRFWAEFGQSSLVRVSTLAWTDRIGEITSARGIHFHYYIVLGGYHHAAYYAYMLNNEITYMLKEILCYKLMNFIRLC
jgi:hypothetical protein